jgi:hypothetical protein
MRRRGTGPGENVKELEKIGMRKVGHVRQALLRDVGLDECDADVFSRGHPIA